MMDALGFKGIWRRSGVRERPEIVVEKLAAMQAATTLYLDGLFTSGDARARLSSDGDAIFESVEASFLSDTVVLGVAVKRVGARSGDGVDGFAVRLACQVAAKVMAEATRSEPVLAYRGCISFGQFELHDRFLVGPAVDEAAGAMDLAQGALVWLVPSALTAFNASRIDSLDGHASEYVPFAIPLKGGDRYDSIAVSPFAAARTVAERDARHRALAATFAGGGLEVEIKRQHTMRFFAACSERWRAPVVPARGLHARRQRRAGPSA